MYVASSLVVRHYLQDAWFKTQQDMVNGNTKAVGYLSAEFLMGKQLRNALLNAGMIDQFDEAVKDLGFEPQDVIDVEHEPASATALGRLAACFIDSLASLGVPAFGYGIQYKYGIFEQAFDKDGKQIEKPDYWLTNEEPWGHIDYNRSQKSPSAAKSSKRTARRSGSRPGPCAPCPSTTWSPATHPAASTRCACGAPRATTNSTCSPSTSPNTSTPSSRRSRPRTSPRFSTRRIPPRRQGAASRTAVLLRGRSLHDAIRVFYPGQSKPDLTTFPSKITFQLNDTHPVIGIPELMRILIDEYGYDWDTAWSITTKTFNYTCHTLLPEALEVWPAKLISELLPRHMEIINEINEHFLAELKTKTRDKAKIERMRIVTDEENPKVRMAYLATAGGSHVNGVAELHSELLKDVTLRDFSDLYGDKFTNVTNGVTPRRFIRLANPRLSALITEGLGTDKWLSDLELLKGLEPLAKDDEFVKKFAAVKQANKEDFTAYAKREYGFDLDPNTMFNTMVKRLHEYKRQSLKILALIAKYADIKSGRVSADDVLPRTVIFGAKSAPGYYLAKMTIQLINNVARVVNNDPDVKGKLHVFFPWNYTSASPSTSSQPPTSTSKSPRPARSVRHRQHEVRPQRRPHRRYVGRCERRNP